MKKYLPIISLASLAILVAPSAFADKPAWAGKGKPGSEDIEYHREAMKAKGDDSDSDEGKYKDDSDSDEDKFEKKKEKFKKEKRDKTKAKHNEMNKDSEEEQGEYQRIKESKEYQENKEYREKMEDESYQENAEAGQDRVQDMIDSGTQKVEEVNQTRKKWWNLFGN